MTTLTSARIARIENLPQEEQDKLGKTEGFAIIEIRNSEPKEEIKILGGDGIRGYFLSLGEFKDIPIAN
jgi:hypothetical protein